MSSSRLLLGLALLGLLAGGGILVFKQTPPPTPKVDNPPPAQPSAKIETPEEKPKDPSPPPPDKNTVEAAKNQNIFIGRFPGRTARTINTVLATRKGTEVFQGMIRYDPVPVPLAEVQGLNDILETLRHQNRQIPSQIYRIDQETEALLENLGEPVRSITSYHAYVNPLDWHIIAYDLAMTTGGQAQRFVGHLNKQGVVVDIFRGGDPVDRHEIPFPSRDTFILPMQMEFIHNWYQDPANIETKTKAEPVKFSVFIPEVMGFVRLVAKPLGNQVIPVQDANQDCARYEVLAVSTQSSEGLTARQEMWFDIRSGVLMKREDFDATMKPGEASVMERAKIGALSQIRQLVTPVPQVPDKPLPYLLDKEMVYKIQTHDKDIGKLRIKFSKFKDPTDTEAEFLAESAVTIDAEGAMRQETATTYFDKNWRARRYEAEGTETAGAKAAYKVGATIGHGKVDFSIQRKVEEMKPAASAEAPAEHVAVAETKPGEWHDPVVRVPVSDKEAEAEFSAAAVPHLTDQNLSRKVAEGTFLYDFNRVEQLATLVHRLPLPPVPAEHAAPETTYQRAGIFLVRQNRAGVLLFETRPEVKPVLTERQKRRQDAADRSEPQLYVASVAGVLLPCKMLLTPDGRLLQLTTKHGSGEVIYTLDDPIMRHRADRAKLQRLQEGPQLLRPPWW